MTTSDTIALRSIFHTGLRQSNGLNLNFGIGQLLSLFKDTGHSRGILRVRFRRVSGNVSYS